MKIFVLSALIILLSMPQAWATVTVNKPSCGVWVEWRKSTNDYKKLLIQEFVVGELSGLSLGSSREFWGVDGHQLDYSTVYLWMDQYCEKNPLSSITEGVEQLFINVSAQAK